jgi:hypothetical protein
MRNHTLVVAITLLICLTSSGKLQAAGPDLDGKAPNASKPAARLKLPPNALASDPVTPLKTAPQAPVKDGSSWTGFYAGGHGGSGFGQENSPRPFPDR